MKRGIAFLLAIAGAVHLASSVEWSHETTTVVEQSTSEGQTQAVVENSDGERFSVSYRQQELTEEDIEQIIEVADRFYDWEYISIGTLRFLVSPQAIEAYVLPDSIEFQDREILPYVPAGLTFYLTDELRYDFRMRQENFFMSLEGLYLTENELLEQMVDAIDDPSAYVRRTDPTYYMSKFDQLDRQMEEVRQNIRDLSSQMDTRLETLNGRLTTLNGQLDSLSGQLETLTSRFEEAIRVAREEQQRMIDIARQEQQRMIQEGRQLLEQQRQELTERMDQQQEELSQEFTEGLTAAENRIAELEQSMSRLRYASVLDESRRIFGILRDVPRERVDQVVEAKESNPDLTVDQLSQQLEEDGVEVHDSVIEAVFRIYFNEIPE